MNVFSSLRSKQNYSCKMILFYLQFVDVGLTCTPPSNDSIGDVWIDKGMIDLS